MVLKFDTKIILQLKILSWLVFYNCQDIRNIPNVLKSPQISIKKGVIDNCTKLSKKKQVFIFLWIVLDAV